MEQQSFDIAAAETSTAVVDITTAPTLPMPAANLVREWERLRDFARTTIDNLAAIGLDAYAGRDMDVPEFLDKHRARIFSALVSVAESEFAPSGGALSIKEDAHATLKGERNDPFAFNPQALWSALHREYAGECGVNLAWTQAADILRKHLFPQSVRAEPRHRVRGHNVLFHLWAVHQSSFKPRPKVEYTYTTIEAIVKLVLRGLIPFLAHESARGNELGSAQGLHAYARDRLTYSHGFDSRETVKAAPFAFTHYKDKIELVVPAPVFADINLFIATYGSRDD